ncbi:hypothetical protein [Breoghania sp. L-A4]|uniref:hypothetical protein n=1 Tax=Breoghania sp. L-A4 TaxID=2304600 RepID=UPI000E35B285|nr:hypothetical protein [Breoghania sp. L-A4]AXS38766.1 hypothetical protein D1F64_00210 [Breoghania sp. L-A4]
MSTLEDELTIEVGGEPQGGCPCCDPFAAAPQGYVLRNGEPLAVYYSDGRIPGPLSAAEVTISMGRWHETSTAADRRTASFRLTRAGNKTVATGLNANDSRWAVLATLGPMLTRAELAADPKVEVFRRVALAIAARDPRIIEALQPRDNETARLTPRKTGGPFTARPASLQDTAK